MTEVCAVTVVRAGGPGPDPGPGHHTRQQQQQAGPGHHRKQTDSLFTIWGTVTNTNTRRPVS